MTTLGPITSTSNQRTSPGVSAAAQQALVVRLEHELVAPCCYTQLVADHMSAEAEDMRQEILQLVSQGKTEQQILQAYKARYGEVILAAPDGLAGKVAFGVPPLACSLAACMLIIFLLRWRQKPVPLPAEAFAGSRQMLDRIRAETGSSYK